MTYQEQIKAIEDYMDASLGVNGEITKKAEEAVKEMKAASDDLISRQAAIDEWKNDFKGYVNALDILRDDYNGIMEYIDELPSAQPEPSTEIQEILNYLDTTLHPIVSPDNWNVYSELHDMVSKLPSVDAVPVVRCKDCEFSKPINAMVIECTIWADARLKADFCSAGERKERDNDS